MRYLNAPPKKKQKNNKGHINGQHRRSGHELSFLKEEGILKKANLQRYVHQIGKKKK